MTFSRSKAGSALTRIPRQAWVLEPRMMFDAAAVVTAVEVAAHVAATDTTPGVDATPVKATVTITDSSDSFPAVDLFRDVHVSADNNGQELKDLVISVNRTGANQALSIDGKSIALEAGSGTTRGTDETPDGFAYTVTVSGNTTTITVNIDGFTNKLADTEALIDSIAYQPLDKTVASGEVTVTLKSLSDEGNSVDLNIHSTITIDSLVNVAPVVSGDVLSEAEAFVNGTLTHSTEVAYSSDGHSVYAAGSDNTITVFSVDDLGHLTQKQSLVVENLGTVNHLVVSSDGKSVYTVSGNGNLVHLSVNDGLLSVVKTISLGTGANGGLAISDDGKQVYVDATSNFSRKLQVYTRDVATGELTLLQTVNSIRNSLITTSGDYVYVAHSGATAIVSHELKVYQRNATTGKLELLSSIALSNKGQDAVDYALVTSKDGKLLYVGNPTAANITVYQLGSDNTLKLINTIASDSIGSLTLNSAGTQLYAATTAGTVQVYTVTESGGLTLTGSSSGSTNGSDIAVSADGKSILVSGNGLSRYSSIQTLLRGEAITLAHGLTLSDANNDRLAGGVGEYGGMTLTLSRAAGAQTGDRFGFAAGSGLRLVDGQIFNGDTAIATFSESAGTLTLTFLTGVTKANANAVLHQITYSNSGTEADGTVVRLALRANDGKADSQSVTLDVLLTRNTAPVLDAIGIVQQVYDTHGTVVNLFSSATVNAGEIGQSIVELTVKIDGVEHAANEFILIAGTRIDLAASSTGQVGDYQYTYTVNGDSGTLTIGSTAGISAMTVQTLVNGIAYVNDTEHATTGQRSITLVSLRDNGGTDSGGKDTGEPGISATLVLAINNAPSWQTTITDPDTTLYYNNGTLSGYSEYVTDIVVSPDGKTLMVSGSDKANADGTSTLRIYSRDSTTGELTLVQTFTQGESDNPDTTAIEANGLNTITTMVMQGNDLYVAGRTNTAVAAYSLVRFTYDATTGLFTYAGIVATQDVNGVTGLDAQISEIALSADGTSLYTINGVSAIDSATGKSALAQFSRDPATGALTYLGVYQGGTAELGMDAPSGIVISDDGKSVYVSNRKDSMLTQFSRNTETGVLTYVSFINATTIAADPASGESPGTSNYLSELQDIVISPDGAFVYVGSGQQATISIFSRDASDGKLTYVGTTSLYSAVSALNIRELALSSDGGVLYVGFNGSVLAVLSRDSTSGALTYVNKIDAGLRTNQIAVTADGLNIYSGRSQFTTGVSVLSALPHARYSTSGAVTFAGELAFSDVDADRNASYQGITLTLARVSGASVDDLFSFKATADLRLVDGKIVQGETAIADFTLLNGTLTLTFTAGVDQATANQVLQHITYRNSNVEPPARVDLQVSVRDEGGKSDVTLVTLVLNKPPVANDAIYVPPSGIAGQYYEQTLPADLFSDPENGALTWQVSGLPSGLTFDASTHTISGTLALNHTGRFAITVVVSDDAGESVEQILTLTVASDPGQLPTIGGESTALEKDHSLQEIYDENIGSDVMNGVKDSAVSADGKFLYVVSAPYGGASVLSVFVRNEEGEFTLSKALSLAGASEVILSADRQHLYVVDSEENTVVLFQIGSEGELTQEGVIDRVTLNGYSLDERSQLVSQGDYLYLTAAQSDSDNDSRSVLVLKRQTDGSITRVSQADNLIGASTLVADSSGRYLFVSGSGSTVGITVFSIDVQGTLTQVGQLTGTSEYYINALALSPDGKTLYAIHADVGNYTLNTLTVGDDGALTLKSTWLFTDSAEDSGEALATDLVVSADGTALFVVGKNITVFSRAENGDLTLKQTLESGWHNVYFSALQQVEISADGKQLYLVGGDKIQVLNVGTAGVTYTEGDNAIVLLPSGHLSDPQLDALNVNGEKGDYNGASITVGRQSGAQAEDTFGFNADNGLTLEENRILKEGVAIASFTSVEGVLTVKFTASVTQADAQNVLRQITYQNTSQDPEHAGTSPKFTFSLNDGDNNVSQMDITVTLIGVNDPTVLTTTVLNPTIPGNGEFVKLFKDTHVDTIESGQKIWQLVLTFDVSGPNEAISVDGGTIVLEASSGTPRTASGLQYAVKVVDGKATVTLYLMKSGSDTANIIDSIGYNYLGSDPSGERHVTLSVRDDSYRAALPETETTLADSITLTLAPAAETNTAPVITIPGTTPTYTERAEPVALAPDATVSDAQMDKLNGGKGNYDGATLKITLGDGKTALDKLGFSAGNGLTLSGSVLQKDGVIIGQVSNKDGVLTIRFNANAGTIPTTEDVQNTLRQITYASDSHTPAAQVAVTVTLSDRYLVSQVTAMSVAITAINDTPVVANDPVLSADELRLVNTYTAISGLGTVTAAARTADGLAVYVSDDKGAIALFQRDANSGELTYVRTFAAAEGVTGISQLQVSADGNSVYALRADGNAIVWFSRDANGALTHHATIESNYDIDDGNLNDIKGIALSGDGKTLYLINGYNIVWFTRDVTTGKLNYVGLIEGDMQREPYLWQPSEIVSRGNLLFVTTNAYDGSSLIVYSRDEFGKPVLLGYARTFTDVSGNALSLSGLTNITVSADGRSIAVASADHIDAFALDTATGTFTHLARVAAEGTVSDIGLSADARVLYATKGDGSLTRYVLNDKTLIPLDTLTSNGSSFAHLLPVDGGLITLGNGVSVLDETSRLPVYRVDGPAVIVTPAIVLSDAELDALNGGAGNYQGASITLQRGETATAGDRFDFTAGNGFTLANGVISKDGQAVATFTQVDGKLTVTFTAAISRADATALARQISWATSASLVGNATSLTLVLNDGEIDSAAQTLGIALSREVNLPPVGHAELFTPPAAQVGSNWSYTLPTGLFSDPENDALTFTVDAAQLPNGVSFDSATRTLSGTPSTTGTFNVTITATDSAGNATALTVALTVNAASTPVDPDTPTEPVNPDNSATAAPVILVPQGVSLPADAAEREREQPLGAIVADLSRSDAQPQSLPASITAEPARQRAADTTRPSDAPWVLDPVMSQLMPTLDQVNFSSRAEAAIRDNAAVRSTDSDLFLNVRGQPTALESAFSSVQGALQPDASGALAFSLPQRMFSVREGNATLTLQLANGRPLPTWVQFDARSGVVRITDASAVQVNQIQLALKAQAADGTSRIVPITLQTGQGSGAEMPTDRGAMQWPVNPAAPSAENREAERLAPAGKTAFTEQLRQHQPEQDALLAALSELSSLRA